MTPLVRSLRTVAACMVMLVLAGCAANPGVGIVSRNVPDGVTLDLLSGSPAATWLDRGETFAVVTIGSSSCPAVATAIEVESGNRLSVTFGPSPNNPCTADMAPTTHEFDLPAGVSGDSITVEIRFEDWPDVYTIDLD